MYKEHPMQTVAENYCLSTIKYKTEFQEALAEWTVRLIKAAKMEIIGGHAHTCPYLDGEWCECFKRDNLIAEIKAHLIAEMNPTTTEYLKKGFSYKMPHFHLTVLEMFFEQIDFDQLAGEVYAYYIELINDEEKKQCQLSTST